MTPTAATALATLGAAERAVDRAEGARCQGMDGVNEEGDVAEARLAFEVADRAVARASSLGRRR